MLSLDNRRQMWIADAAANAELERDPRALLTRCGLRLVPRDPATTDPSRPRRRAYHLEDEIGPGVDCLVRKTELGSHT